jgi:hypothetical protein
MQIAPKNLFRYHGDGAQWNAGLGEIVYKKLGWRTAALIGDDYSFPWTSAAGIIADFCGIGGKITKRVWTPPAVVTTRRSSASCRRPTRSTATSGSSEERTRALRSPRSSRPMARSTRSSTRATCSSTSSEANTTVAPRLVGSYFGGFGTFQTGGLKTKQAAPT